MRFVVLIFLVLIFGVFVSSEVGIDPEVLERFDSGEEKVEVIVGFSDNFSSSGFGVSGEDKELVRMNISERGLGFLLEDEAIFGIESVRYFSISLGGSVDLVNASSTWSLKASGINLTGFSQAVCVIDTGINYSHPDILGRNLTACNIDCISGACVENCSEEDLNGHGTHVAGIVGASGGIDGIAKGVGLIGLKVFPGANRTGATSNGISNAIDWCVDNSESYNISVISMSLGTDTLYSSVCDSSFSATITPAVNAAFAKNISVVAASGNDGDLVGIGSPACISSVIAAGGADRVGGMYIDGNRNSLVSLLGIATSVNSTQNVGGYTALSGTSMATPMISGAIAIVNGLLGLTSRTMTPFEIESSLNESGLKIYDAGSGRNYSRINIYDAVLSLDSIAPDVLLVSPVDNYVGLDVNHSFVCNATDWQLLNVTFRIWNSSGIYFENSSNFSGTGNSSEFNFTGMPLGEYFWNCFVEDVKGNSGNASNFSLTVGSIEVSLESPANGSFSNVNETFFNCTSRSDSDYGLENVTFNLWNSSGILLNSSVRNISGFDNTTSFNYTFGVDGEYVWNCVAYNNNSDVGSGTNFSLTYDSNFPVISDLSTSVTSSSAVISWSTNESANSSVAVSNGTWVNSSGYTNSHSISVSSLDASAAYTYVAQSCDRSANCVNSSGNFTTSAVAGSGSSGSGGGGGSSVKVFSVKNSELWKGKAELLGVGNRLNFNLVSGGHDLEVKRVGKDYAEIEIRSEPVFLNLSVGENVKLNLSSAGYYDLVVGLENILNGRANISVRRIFEEIVVEVLPENNETEALGGEVVSSGDSEGDIDLSWIGIVLVGIFGVFWFWVNHNKPEKKLIRKKLRHVHRIEKVLVREAKKEHKLKRHNAKKKV